MDFVDWQGNSISVARSRGGVLACEDFSDNLIRTSGSWPPPEILQKLYRSRQETSFEGADLRTVTRRLGYYCDLQSLHSEDAITWSFFGPLVRAEAGTRVEFLNWFLRFHQLPATESSADASLWRRIPHPDKPVSGGPEIDFLLVGSGTVVLGEAKWRSSEGTGQGVDRNKGQLQLREEFAGVLGSRIFPGFRFVVVMMSLVQSTPTQPQQGPVQSVAMSWADLTTFDGHPQHAEFAKYYRWKLAHSKAAR